jgi:hypothetical protein
MPVNTVLVSRCRWETVAFRLSMCCALALVLVLMSGIVPANSDQPFASGQTSSQSTDELMDLLRHQRFALCDKIQRIIFRRPNTTTSMYFVGDSTALHMFRATVATSTRCMAMFARRRGDAAWLSAARSLISANREMLRQITQRVTRTSPRIKIAGWADPSTRSTLNFYFVRALYAAEAGLAVSSLSDELCAGDRDENLPVISVHVGTWDLLRPSYKFNGYELDQNYSRNSSGWHTVTRIAVQKYVESFVRPVEAAAELCKGSVIVSAVARPNCSASKFSRSASGRLGGGEEAGESSGARKGSRPDPYRFAQRGACRRLIVGGTWKAMHTATLSFHHATVRDADALVWQQEACSLSDGVHIDAEEDELGEVADPLQGFIARRCRLFAQQSLWNVVVTH